MIVLDASALVDVLIDQPAKPWILDQLRGRQIVAPAHQPAEVLSALARLVRSGTLAGQAAVDALREASMLQQELVPPTSGQLVRALELQDRRGLLDALYVVLAQDREAVLLTTDRRLSRGELPVPALAPPEG